MRNRGLLLLACLAVVLVPAFSANAQTVIRGMTSDGKNKPVKVTHAGEIYVRDSTLVTDANSILRVTEEYPAQYQTDRTTLCTNDTVRIGLKYMGFWYCAPWGQRTLYVSRAEGGSGVDLCYLYLYGSDDNLTYYPILQDAAWSDGVTAGAADTLLCDTLRVSLPMGFNAAKFTLPGSLYPGRYLSIFAKRDSSTGSASVRNFQTLTITAEGRMQ